MGTNVYLMTALGLAVIYGLPHLTKAVPSPLVTIVLMTGLSIYFGFDMRRVGDMGQLPTELPLTLPPDCHRS
jgi:SulP family sulfate permease